MTEENSIIDPDIDNEGPTGVFQNIPFEDLIGGPLVAIIKGQTLASRATAEFIQEVGFGNNYDFKGDQGELQMVEFSFAKKSAGNGSVEKYQAKIPLLSILPIPAIQIRDAELDFYVKIIDVQKTQNEKVILRASLGKMRTQSQRETQMDFQMRVKMNIEQADLPPGLVHMLRIMDQSTITSGNEVISEE